MPADHPMWVRVCERISALPDGNGREAAWLTKALGFERVQTAANWRQRGIPSSQHAAVAKALGWTVEQLLSDGAAPSTAQTLDGWPFKLVSPARIAALPEHWRGIIDAALLRGVEEAEALARRANDET